MTALIITIVFYLIIGAFALVLGSDTRLLEKPFKFRTVRFTALLLWPLGILCLFIFLLTLVFSNKFYEDHF